MIKINLINYPSALPLCLAEHAAKTCYQAEVPELKTDETLVRDFVDKRLFKTSHHTTIEHQNFTFSIEDIAISDVTFGLHLASPFYNSDQRSGRFCGKMFTNPDYNWIENYIKYFWPEVGAADVSKILAFVKQSVEIYQSNIEKATELAKDFIRQERPYVSDKYVEQNAPKIAQEQLRVFIPTILPTALDFSVDLSALVALWTSAWTPVLRFVSDKMKDAVVEKFPELDFMFDDEKRNQINWSPSLNGTYQLNFKPVCRLLDVLDIESFKNPEPAQTQPVDLLHFLPNLMDNNIGEVRTEVEISVATMGQDQRHRTVKRGEPVFTKGFYCPPVVRELITKEDEVFFQTWINELRDSLPSTLHTAIAPYGAMVRYKKAASFNALLHEQSKRLCWSAQEEIYHLSCLLRSELSQKFCEANPLVKALVPPCKEGKCSEGDRYCGRDIRTKGSYFPDRLI